MAMIRREVIAGDTFPIIYKHKENGVLANLPEGYDLMIGLHQEGSKQVTTFSYLSGDIDNPEPGIYKWQISHDMSKALRGSIIVEVAIYSIDGSFVKHCIEQIKLNVIGSQMNEYLDNDYG